jgi:hypothetical protein
MMRQAPMRLEREQGPVRRRREVERAHEDLTGQYKPFWQIAAELYDRFGTGLLVRNEIERRYAVPVCQKTVSLWINRGIEERKRVLAAAEEDRQPAGVA